jgi:hypothetical protein
LKIYEDSVTLQCSKVKNTANECLISYPKMRNQAHPMQLGNSHTGLGFWGVPDFPPVSGSDNSL